MKQLLTCLTLILVLVACKKDKLETHHTYSIHVGRSHFIIGATSKLVVTASGTGKYLGSFDLPNGVSDFTGKFEVEGPLIIDSFDLHLIEKAASQNDYPYVVYSQVGVLDGSFVYFNPFESLTTTAKGISLKISGITTFDSIATGFFNPKNIVLDEPEKTLSLDIPTLFHQGIVFRLRANGSSGFRYLYLPETVQGDTLSLTWNDLIPETNLKQIEIQGNPYVWSFEVDAISPDYKNAISICRSWNATPLPTFNLPETLPGDWKLRVRIFTAGFSCERLFDMQTPLVITAPDMTIDHVAFSNNQIVVNTSGDVDYICCSSFEGDFYWNICGSKTAFAKVTLPDLSPFLPASVKQSSIKGFIAQVRQYGGYNAQEIQAGFPYLNPGFFPVARSGFYEIQKSF